MINVRVTKEEIVVRPSEDVIQVRIRSSEVRALVSENGIQGPAGETADPGVEIALTPAASSFSLAVPASMGRRPSVTLYDQFGEEFEADVYVTLTQVFISGPKPFTGTAVLT